MLVCSYNKELPCETNFIHKMFIQIKNWFNPNPRDLLFGYTLPISYIKKLYFLGIPDISVTALNL